MSVALIFYGRGGDLGNFEVFATSLGAQLGRAGQKVKILRIERRDEFFGQLLSPPVAPGEEISALHVFAHSIGGGLFLAYGDTSLNDAREKAVAAATASRSRVSYLDLLNLEAGAVFSDDLLREPYLTYGPSIRRYLARKATVKIWGCNSGVTGWLYQDNGVVDPRNFTQPYYWRALNERNMPKPSIAQALATYLQRTVYGASSGSHIEVLHRGEWVTSSRYKATVGQWPSGALVHRLNPDRGKYDAYHP